MSHLLPHFQTETPGGVTELLSHTKAGKTEPRQSSQLSDEKALSAEDTGLPPVNERDSLIDVRRFQTPYASPTQKLSIPTSAQLLNVQQNPKTGKKMNAQK